MIYTATIRHHSIKRARVIECGPNLRAAKAKATREFGDDFQDHEIVIYEGSPYEWFGLNIVCGRVAGERRWKDYRL